MKRIHVIALVVAVALVALPVLAQYGITNFSGVHMDGAFSTATPILLVAPATSSVSNAIEVRNPQGTPVFYVNSSGALYPTTFPNLAAPYKITVPTAQTTATPGLQIDSLSADGDTVLISKDAGTPVARLDQDGNVSVVNVDASGYAKAGVGTPVVVTSLGAGDAVFSDDVEVVDDMHVTGAMKVGVPTPNAGMTWDDDDLVVGDDFGVIDDSWFGDNVEINGDITLENDEKIVNSSDGTIGFTDGTNTLMTIVDGGSVGNLSVTGTAGVTGHTTLTGGATLPLNATSGVGLPLVVSKSFTYTAAAGATYDAFIIPENQKIIIHSVLCNVTTNFDATGDDATMNVGDANDADGFLVLTDTELQAADTEGTGFAAGWQGMADATIGVYLDEVDSGFVVVAPAGGYTVTYTLDETSGDTLAGGAATLYMIYTRIL